MYLRQFLSRTQPSTVSLSPPRGRYPALGLLLALALVGCQQEGGAGPAAGKGRPPVLVETWTAARSTIADKLESIGTLAGNESVTITAKVTDQVYAVHFEDGQMARAGDVLVELVDAEQVALRNEAEANLREARLQLARLQRLGSEISTVAQIDVAEARVKASEARLSAIEARVEERLIRAPFDGQLGFREVSPGALVTPGTVVTQLDDIRRMKLDFAVPETHLANIAVGNTVLARSPAWPEEVFRGEVVSIGSRVDPVTRAITVRATVDNADLRLRPGMLMSLVLIVRERQALVVPEEALVQVGGSSMLYLVAQGDKAERRPVTIGKRVRGGVVIREGLAEGERVVTKGQFNLRPGAAVRLAGGETMGGGVRLPR